MDIKLSISQTAKLLGITTDAIRLYEKEGLVKPKRNVQSNYRYYEWEQIRLLMFIAFYRKLDVSIPEIKLLLTSSTFDDVHKTFEELIEYNRRQAELLNAKNKRLAAHNRAIMDLADNIGNYKISTMPRGYKMLEKFNADTEYRKINTLLSSPIFSYGNIGYLNYFDENGITDRYMSYIIWENLIDVAPIDKPVCEYPILESCECVCTSTTGHGNGFLDLNIKDFTDYCTANGYTHSNYYYAFYAYSIPDGDKIADYYKVYFPIKNEKST